jgi:hypothetical protein
MRLPRLRASRDARGQLLDMDPARGTSYAHSSGHDARMRTHPFVAFAECLTSRAPFRLAQLCWRHWCPTEISFVSPHNITDEARESFPDTRLPLGPACHIDPFRQCRARSEHRHDTAPAAGKRSAITGALGSCGGDARARSTYLSGRPRISDIATTAEIAANSNSAAAQTE